MTRKPVIGLSGNCLTMRTGMFPGYRRAFVNEDYVTSVVSGGGIPVILPFIDAAGIEDRAERLLDTVDALILTGGQDVSPLFYGETSRQKLEEIWPERDLFDRDLLFAAINRGMPVFGVCRGFQFINAALGGKLLQDLSYSETELQKHLQGHSPGMPTHVVRFSEGNIFYDLFGAKIVTNSFHHQTVIQPGNGLTVCGKTDDGVIEAVSSDEMNLIATQWHPEMMSATSEPMRRLFSHFIGRAKDYYAARHSRVSDI